MPLENPDLITLVKAAPYAVFAMVGGFLGSTLRSIDRNEKVRWGRVSIETLSSGFVGLLVLLIADSYGFNGPLSGFIAGVLGWAGAPASMLIFERVVLKRLGVTKPDSAGGQDVGNGNGGGKPS